MAAPVLRRSLLYVPASSPKMLTKSLTLASDNITYDLEDAVTESAKLAARTALKAHLEGLAQARSTAAATPHAPPTGKSEIAVRINAVSTRHALADLTTLGHRALSAVDAIVVPKVNAPSDLAFVADVVAHIRADASTALSDHDHDHDAQQLRAAGPKLLALVESARAVMDLRAICAEGVAASNNNNNNSTKARLDGLIFAAEDFALDLSLTRTPSLTEFLYARSAVVTAARAFGLTSALDLVCTAFRGEDGRATLADECRNGRGLGFTGKQCIHPTQVAVVQQVFGRVYDESDRAELAWAVRVLVAAAKAAADGRGAFVLDGSMVDAPVLGKAQRLIDTAERGGAGDFVQTLREKHKDQEPE
ncbi:carbon-carbon lyase [Niveomyces insectorum RCEF 264]|uniref:Carbon-carbon lyase n=1 Tax=Niveomyces insectorum RCEF 264 TaxID=1081102 RepID=A0A167PE97_9HYPO|nr:carbon-carbon lyase [Niveomyces insectorum RCEF 264]